MLKGILSYGLIEGIAKGLNKLILLSLPFFLTTVDFGKIGLILSIETMLPYITLLGLERAILRFYSEKSDLKDFDKTLNIVIGFTHFLLIAGLSLLYLSGIRSVFGLSVFPDMLLLTILVYLQGYNQFVLNKFRVESEHKKYFKARLFLQIGKFILVLSLVYFSKSYLGYLYGGIIIALVTNLLFRAKVNEELESNQHFNKGTFKYLFLFSWPFVFHGIAANLLGNADKFILEKILTLNEVGLYTFVYSIGSMMVFGYVGISIYMEPLIYKSTLPKREYYIENYILYSGVISLLLFLSISIFSEFFLQHFYGAAYLSVAHLIPSIAISYALYSYYLTANYRLIYDKRTNYVAVMSIFSVIVNISLNFILIPFYGLNASVWVTFISYFLQAVLFTIVSFKRVTSQLYEIIILGSILFLLLLFESNFLYEAIVLLLFVLYKYFKKDISERIN